MRNAFEPVRGTGILYYYRRELGLCGLCCGFSIRRAYRRPLSASSKPDGAEDSTCRPSIARIVLILIHHRFNVIVDLRNLKVINCKSAGSTGSSPEGEGLKHDGSTGDEER